MALDWRLGGSVELLVPARPDEVYRVVTDVTSTGERSTECRRATWLPGGPQCAEVGAWFRGRNRSGLARWSRVCEVVETEPGRRFAFRTVPERVDLSRTDLSRADSTTWRYELVLQADGTMVRHSYEITRLPLRPFQLLYGVLMPHHRDMRPAMQYALNRLAEAVAGPDLRRS